MEMNKSQTIKHDWYQSETQVCINVLVKNTRPENVRVDITGKTLTCTIKIEDENEELVLILAHEVEPSRLTWKVLPSKIEIKLPKVEAILWTSLTEDKSRQILSSTISDIARTRPTSVPQKKNWDRLVSELDKEEESEKLEGEAGLNQLFQRIYAEGTDEQKMAMNKSFMESGGTVLSTNWQEVAEKKIDVKPPDGMEWKKWD